MTKKIEELAPPIYMEELENRRTQLVKAIRNLQIALNRNEKTELEGHIRIVPHGKKLQFYHITEKGDTIGKYLSRSMDDAAIQLVQNDFNRKTLKAWKTELSRLNSLVALMRKKSSKVIFDRMSQIRKQLVTPLTLPDFQYAEAWSKVQYAGNDFDFGTGEFYTSKGERVRSKSEVIIAETLIRMNVSYRYEFPVYLKSIGKNVHPDFYCLNVRTRQEFCWEHFGMMDNPEYAQKAVEKIGQYAKSGMHPGQKLLCTFETSETPLNSKIVEQMVEAYLV